MGAPAGANAWRERCALRLTTDRARMLFDAAVADEDGTGDGDAPSGEPDEAWWAAVQTFYGQDEPNVPGGGDLHLLTRAGRDSAVDRGVPRNREIFDSPAPAPRSA